ncbi:hypothetical protein AAFH68_27040 [Flavobacterium sp. CGRL1]
MKQSIKPIALCLMLFLFTAGIFAQNKAQQIEQLLAKYNEYGQFNGSALVAENGKVILKKRFWSGKYGMEYSQPARYKI